LKTSPVKMVAMIGLAAFGFSCLYLARTDQGTDDARMPSPPISVPSLLGGVAKESTPTPPSPSGVTPITKHAPTIQIYPDWLGMHIGSEGYGPHIRDIAASGSPGDSLAAYRMIIYCQKRSWAEANFAESRATADSKSEYGSPAYLNQRAARLDADRGRCQTVDESVQKLGVTLGKRAAEANVEGGAEAYADAVLASRDSPEWPIALQHLHAAADRMDGTAFAMLAWGDPSVPIDDVERRAYQIVLDMMAEKGWESLGGASSRVGAGVPAYAVKLSPIEADRALQMAQEIYLRCCANWKKK